MLRKVFANSTNPETLYGIYIYKCSFATTYVHHGGIDNICRQH